MQLVDGPWPFGSLSPPSSARHWIFAGPISSIAGFADPVSGSWDKSDKAMWQADITAQLVDFASLAGTPQIKYSIGSGVLYGPVDALVLRTGDR